LEHTSHTRSVEVVEEGINVDEDSSHATIDEGCPPPLVIFSRQLEVQQCHSNEGRDNDQKNKGNEQNTEESVDLVSPHGSENVVKFNVDCRERKKSCNENLEWSTSVPRDLCWDFTGHFGGPCRSIEVRRSIVLGQDSSKNRKWEGQEDVQSANRQYCRKRKSTCGTVGNRHRVDPQKYSHHRCRKESSCNHDALHPVFPSHLSEQSNGSESCYQRRQTIQDYETSQNGTSSSRRYNPGERQAEMEKGHHDELIADSYGGAEKRRVLREAEDVAMNQLPSRLLMIKM
jgi:hypothetical protein